MHHNMSSSEQQTSDVHLSDDSVMRLTAFNTNADMTVKIPPEKLENFLNTVSHMGIHVNERKMNIEDKTLDYLSSQMKLDNRKELVAQQRSGKVVFKDPNSVLDLKDDLVEQQIDSKMIDDQVKYSVVCLSFHQSNTITKEVIANDDPSTYNLPFFKSAEIAFANGWYMFKTIIVALINVWIFVVAGIAAWLILRHYKRKGALSPN